MFTHQNTTIFILRSITLSLFVITTRFDRDSRKTHLFIHILGEERTTSHANYRGRDSRILDLHQDVTDKCQSNIIGLWRTPVGPTGGDVYHLPQMEGKVEVDELNGGCGTEFLLLFTTASVRFGLVSTAWDAFPWGIRLAEKKIL